ncbi:MAG: aminodeoxychorismate lyase [Vibrio sp.]
MILVNGVVAEHISVSDRAFQYGDGCFTTMLTCNGHIQQWQYHQERVAACLDALGIRLLNWPEVQAWLAKAALPDLQAGLKLHVSRGQGGRGYSPALVSEPTVTIQSFSFPAHYAQWQSEGIDLGLCQQRLGLNPLLAGHKHNNRLEQVLMKAEMDKAGWQDGLCCDLNDHVIETTMANIFWVKDDILCTPDLSYSGVAGVARRCVIEAAQDSGLTVAVGRYCLTDLWDAEEVFITNAMLGVAPVRHIQSHSYAVGKYTRRFQKRFHLC